MSWSVSQIGKPAAVKEVLAKDFANRKEGCKQVPHEVEAIGIVEQLANNQLDFLATLSNAGIVKVDASGSAYFSDSSATETSPAKRTGYTNVTVNIQQFSAFVE